jgi:hypothetical protein
MELGGRKEKIKDRSKIPGKLIFSVKPSVAPEFARQARVLSVRLRGIPGNYA